jgi:hypothetical protein
MLNLSAPHLLTIQASVLLIGLAVASLYMRLSTMGPTVVIVRIGSSDATHARLAVEVGSRSLRWQADDLRHGPRQRSRVFRAMHSHCFIRNSTCHRFAHQVFLHFACDRHRE